MPDSPLKANLLARFGESKEAQLFFGAADAAAKALEDVLNVTVRTVIGEGEGGVDIESTWELDGDVVTTILPVTADVSEELMQFHLEQFSEAVNYRLRLIEALLRLAKIDIHLL
jgi:hypothetical protein